MAERGREWGRGAEQSEPYLAHRTAVGLSPAVTCRASPAVTSRF